LLAPHALYSISHPYAKTLCGIRTSTPVMKAYHWWAFSSCQGTWFDGKCCSCCLWASIQFTFFTYIL